MKTLTILLIAFLSASAHAQIERRSLEGDIPYERVEVEDSGIFFHKVKLALFDADSTLRVAPSGSVSANSPTDVQVLPCVAPRIAELNKLGYVIGVFSNQGGIKAGKVSEATATGALQYTISQIQLRHSDVDIHYFDFAGYRNIFRKEQTGMALLLEQKLRTLLYNDSESYGGLIIDKSKSFMVGDSLFKKSDVKPNGQSGIQFSNSDRCFAENYKIRHFDPAQVFGWLNFTTPVALFDSIDPLQTLPSEALSGGKKEVQFCKTLDNYTGFSMATASGKATREWVADYQLVANKKNLSVPLFSRKGCKPLK